MNVYFFQFLYKRQSKDDGKKPEEKKVEKKKGEVCCIILGMLVDFKSCFFWLYILIFNQYVGDTDAIAEGMLKLTPMYHFPRKFSNITP